jgi:hypothetical protein
MSYERTDKNEESFIIRQSNLTETPTVEDDDDSAKDLFGVQ